VAGSHEVILAEAGLGGLEQRERNKLLINIYLSSVAVPGCLSRIRPFYPSKIRIVSYPDPGSASKNLSILI
jgi:hypothetical protein